MRSVNNVLVGSLVLALASSLKEIGSLSRSNRRSKHSWTPEEIQLLGTMSDWDVSKLIGVSEREVLEKREELDIVSFDSNPDYERVKPYGPKYDWTPEKVALLGTMPDRDLAILLGDIHYTGVHLERGRRNIPSFGSSKRVYEQFDFSVIPISAFHHFSDNFISREYGVNNPLWVKRYREENNIMSHKEYFEATYQLCKILPYSFVAKVMGFDDFSLFVTKLRTRLIKDIGSRVRRIQDHFTEDFPVTVSLYNPDSFTPDLLLNIDKATSFMLAYWYPASFYDIEKVKEYAGIGLYRRNITDPMSDLSPDEIALFFTKSDEWNSEAFGIPMKTIKQMRIHYMNQLGLYPPGMTDVQKSRLNERIRQQWVEAKDEVYQSPTLAIYRRLR